MNRPDPQSWALITAGALNAAVVLFLPPPLFVWLLVADLLAGCAALGALYLAATQRADREADVNFGLRVRLTGREAKKAATDPCGLVCERAFTERMVETARDADQKHLRVVPPVADDDWAVHTVVDDDELTALLRATEE